MQQAIKASNEPFDANGWRIAIVTAQFNRHITGELQATAVKRAGDYGISEDSVDIIPVAGCIEIPLVLQHLARSGKYNALLAVGCVIRGDTPHFDYVCQFVTDGVLRVQLDESMPIGFGVITCNDEAQAKARAHLGGEHIDAVLQQAKQLV